MNIKSILNKSLLFIALISLLGCAQFVPPTGGKRDEKPPVLIKSTPPNKSKNFKGKEIELNFDEMIDITSLRQELLVVPEVEGGFEVKQKNNSVNIIFEKPLAPNTTYTLNFRKGIKDLTEKNDSKNLKLVFSTGSEIDSLSIQGNVKNLLTNQPVFDALVGLYYLTDTLNFRKIKPTYFTKTDSSGTFSFENIKSAKYKIYAFTDKNNNLKFDPKNEQVGFKNDTISLTKNLTDIQLYIYENNNEPPKNTKTLQRADDFTILYNKNVKEFHVKFQNKEDSIPYIGSKDELKFFNFPQKKDTIKVEVTVIDSLYNEWKHTQKIKFREPEKKKQKDEGLFSFKVFPKNNEPVEKNYKLELTFETPVRETYTEKIKILADTTKSEPISLKQLSWNLYKNILTINTTTLAKQNVRVTFEKGAFIDVKADSSNKTQINLSILNPDDYGIIEGNILKSDLPLIVQLVDENYQVQKETFTKDRFRFINISPTTYLLRIIKDTNNNQRWDSGNAEKGILPESIYFYEQPIRIKANFELTDLKINLPK